ncbi:Uncharacterised protein [Vibrio cholerae]|nr:Uncharacterised protein [Vibrio cholerae]
MITWKVSIIPVTVPSNPSIGASAASNFSIDRPVSR